MLAQCTRARVQLAKLATYGYFTFALISRQDLRNESDVAEMQNNQIDMYFPFLTTLEFFFYVGWLKVGEELL